MTVPMMAVKLGRRAIGIELASPYFLDVCMYVERAAREERVPGLFDAAHEPEIQEPFERIDL